MKRISRSLSQVRLTYVITTIFLMVLSLYAYFQIKQFRRSVEMVNHSALVSMELQKLLNHMKDAETGHKGYLLTHDSTFLTLFYKGLKLYDAHENYLKFLTRDNETHQKKLANIKLLADTRKKNMLSMLVVDKTNGISTDEILAGESIMASLRNRINEMTRIENEVSEARRKNYSHISFFTPFFIVLLFLGSSVILYLSYHRLVRSASHVGQLHKALRHIVSESQNGVCMLRGPRHYVEVANKMFLSTVDNKDICYKYIRDALPEYKGRGLFKTLDTVFSTGRTIEKKEVAIQITEDGVTSTRLFDFIYRATVNKKKRIDGVVIHATDVTERVQARKKLEQSQARYADLIHKLPVAVYTCDAEGYVQQYNEAAVALWGRAPELGKEKWCGSWRAFRTDGSEMSMEECPMVMILKKGKIVKMPSIIERPDGSRSRVIPYPQLVYDEHGNVSGAICTIIDISEQVSIREKIVASEEQLRIAIDSGEMGAIDYYPISGQLEVTRKTREILGYEQDEVLEFSSLKKVLHPEDIHVYDEITEAVKRPDSQGLYDAEYRIYRNNDGQLRWVRGKGKAWFNTHREIIRFTGIMQDITDAKVAEENSSQLAAIVESSSDAIISKKLDGTILTWNEGAQRVFGYKPDEIIGQSIEKLFPRDRLEEETEIIARILNGERVPTFETKRVTKQNKLIEVSLTISPLRNRYGKIIGASKIARDITRQKRAERIIAENEQRLQILIESSELGMWELDFVTEKHTYDKRYLKILGFKETDTPSRADILERIHPDDMGIREKSLKEALLTGYLRYVVRLVWPDKSIHWMEIRGRVYFDENHLPKRLIGTIRDLSEEKAYQQRIEESEKRFRNLTETLPQLIWVTDEKGNPEFTSSKWEEYTGIKPIGKATWKEIVHPEDLENINTVWKRCLQTGEVYKHEARLRSRTGAYHWHQVIGEPIYDNDKKILKWVGSFTDIHTSKMFQLELENQVKDRTLELMEKNHTLVRANNELELFAQISSHDLQEPLRKVRMSISRIAEKDFAVLSDKGKEHFKRVQDGAHSMQILIDDLQTYSRANNKEAGFEIFDLNNIFETAMDGLEETVNEKKAIIETIGLCRARIIPFEFRQLMHNLISNSLKFSKPNRLPHIVVNCRMAKGSELNHPQLLPDEKYLYFSVSDNGIGFEQQYSEKVFEIFQRLHGKDDYDGTGIGLAIVKKIVENHHGFITARSELNKGATFEIYIPQSNKLK